VAPAAEPSCHQDAAKTFGPRPAGEGFVDGEHDRGVGSSSISMTRVARIRPICWTSSGSGEESVGAGMVPDPGQAGAGQHSTHRSFHRAEDESGEHRGEHLISGAVKQDRKTLQQRRQGIRYTDHGGHWWNTPFIGGVVRTTNVPPHSMNYSASAPTEWHSIWYIKV